jgi:hypothetical protein
MMHTFDESEEKLIRERLLTSRIIVMALLAGELMFCAVALYQRMTKQVASSSESVPILVIVAGLFCFLTFVVLFILRTVKWKMLVPEQSLESFWQRYFAIVVVIPQAICEAPAFFCLVTVLVGAKLVIMMPIFAAIVLVQLWMFPTRARFENIYTQAQERRALQQTGLD